METKASSSTASAALLDRARQLLKQQAVGEALDLLNASGLITRALQNAKAVCLMRLGRPEPAAKVLCDVVLPKGTFTIPEDMPVELRANYAATWFLQGDYVAGSALLGQIRDQHHPAVQRLKALLRTWRNTLPLWHRLLLPLGAGPKVALPPDPTIGELWCPAVDETVGPERRAA